MTQPDLFVVCKNCGSEVSPYVTECPYCGQRVRKRAPKLDRREAEEPPRRGRARLPRLRADELEGIAPDKRPWATMALIAVSLATTLVFVANSSLDLGRVLVGAEDQVWRWFTAPFVHGDALGYQFVTLLTVAAFGSMLERRFGPLPVLATFVLAGAAGCGLAVALDVPALFESELGLTPVYGANGAALGLICAWLVDDRLAARRGDSRGADLLGAYVIAAVVALLSLAVVQANVGAALGGALAGALLGLSLRLFTRRAPI